MRLRRLRQERRLTLEDMSKKLNLSICALARYETEARTIPTDIIKKLSAIYETTVDYLLGLNDFGVFVSYFNFTDDYSKYVVSKSLFDEFVKDDDIYFLEGRRFVDLNKYLKVDPSIDLAEKLGIYFKDDLIFEDKVLTRTMLMRLKSNISKKA